MTTYPGGSDHGSHGSPRPREWRHGGPAAYTRPYLTYPPRPPRPPRRDDPERDRYAYVAPVISSVLMVPLLAVGGFCVMFAPMATDPCTPDGCHALNRALMTAPCVLLAAWLTLGLSWVLPWRLRYRVMRVVPAVVAPLLALAALFIYVHLPAAN
jgi:hypothetical protein